MATSLFVSPISSPTIHSNRELSNSTTLLLKSYFLPNTTHFTGAPLGKDVSVRGRCFRYPATVTAAAKKSLDHIPKQFREGNLKDGLSENFKNVPQYFYGLSPSQMDMFMTENSPVRRQADKVTEETISAAHNYLNHGGMWSASGEKGRGPPKCSMSVSMYGGQGTSRAGMDEMDPPDLPSLLLDARIVYIGMPIVLEVTELIIAQFMWLDYDNSSKPIYLYINSTGTQNEKLETVGSETEAYAIADMIGYINSEVHTINCGMAFGQAAMLLSLGVKGHRGVQPNSSTKLYLPKVNKSGGSVIDMWIKAKELDANADSYLDLLSKGTGKSKEEINNDIQRPLYLQAQDAIDYGIADKILSSRDHAFEKRNYDQMLAQSEAAMRRAGGGGAQAAPSL